MEFQGGQGRARGKSSRGAPRGTMRNQQKPGVCWGMPGKSQKNHEDHGDVKGLQVNPPPHIARTVGSDKISPRAFGVPIALLLCSGPPLLFAPGFSWLHEYEMAPKAQDCTWRQRRANDTTCRRKTKVKCSRSSSSSSSSSSSHVLQWSTREYINCMTRALTIHACAFECCM